MKADSAAQQLKAILEADPPYGARVTFESGQAGTGWHAPQTAPWLDDAIDEASMKHYGKPAMWMGEGGTIPFMAMLGAKFPQAQFLITGVLGPHSNAHGPNEFLHIDYAAKLTAAWRTSSLRRPQPETPPDSGARFGSGALGRAAGCRKAHRDQRSASARGSLDPDARAVQMRDFADDGEAQSAALAGRALHAVEAPEHFLALLDGDAGTVVLDLQDRRARLQPGAYR